MPEALIINYGIKNIVPKQIIIRLRAIFLLNAVSFHCLFFAIFLVVHHAFDIKPCNLLHYAKLFDIAYAERSHDIFIEHLSRLRLVLIGRIPIHQIVDADAKDLLQAIKILDRSSFFSIFQICNKF